VADVELGILPVGTGSDFARALGAPRDPLKAAIHLMRSARPQPLDIGRIDCVRGGASVTRYFANIAGLGFDGEVADRVNRSGKSSGALAYQTTLLRSLAAYQNKHVALTIDGRRQEGVYNSVIACNARYFGGGMFIAPNARWDDGLFDVILLGDFGKIETVMNLPRLYRGTHLTHKKVTELRARQLSVQAQERMFLQAEGELVGEAPVTFSILPQALKILM
jgi:YegS/Rv2252/BmrU family lipid kinase